jgi:ferredoxin
MASLAERLPQNVPGPFYVDASCVDCDLCRSLAPAIFRRHDETGYSYVHRHPIVPDDLAAAVEAMNSCPTESIGNDGAASSTDAALAQNSSND